MSNDKPDGYTMIFESDDVGTSTTLEIDADAVEADELFDAFIAGFMLSGEGHNAEYPYSLNEDDIRDDKHEDFVDWLEDYAPGVWL